MAHPQTMPVLPPAIGMRIMLRAPYAYEAQTEGFATGEIPDFVQDEIRERMLADSKAARTLPKRWPRVNINTPSARSFLIWDSVAAAERALGLRSKVVHPAARDPHSRQMAKVLSRCAELGIDVSDKAVAAAGRARA